MQGVTLLLGDAREVLRTMPSGSVHAIVTSPPYFNQRDYQASGQIGLEKSVDEYLRAIVETFRECRRVLRDDGTLWINVGDKMRDKQLIGVPWKMAFALQSDGWFLRQDIVMHKVTANPEAVRDRCCRSHEYLFLLTKGKQYFFDPVAIMENVQTTRTHSRKAKAIGAGTLDLRKYETPYDGTEEKRNKRTVWTYHSAALKELHFAAYSPKTIEPCIFASTSECGACTKCGAPYVRQTRRTRYATRPGVSTKIRNESGGIDDKVSGNRDPLRHVTKVDTVGWAAQCPCGASAGPSVILDPFCGAGSTGVAAVAAGCRFVGIDLNPEYLRIAARRMSQGSLLLMQQSETEQ